MPTHVIAPTRSFTQLPNEILRNPRLSSDAVRLLAWHVSLPPGADAPPLSDTARRAGIKTTAFQRAKRELKAEGYVHEWRTQGRRGRWGTFQLVSNVPLTDEEARAVRDGWASPSTEEPAVGGPECPPVGRSPEKTGGTTSLPPHHPLADRGAVVLASVAREERRLRLGRRDIQQLAPLAGEWLERGATLAEVREALTAGLPAQIHSVAGLVRNRLLRKMPEAAPAAPPPVPLLTCAGGCGRVVRGADATATCRECRSTPAADVSGAVEATRRGMAAVREALRGGLGPATAPV
ncbi:MULTISPECIES: hypothetical protein [Streptomyces]|uniref:Helix-turn-helix domain-containing protein n=1 Tax=Streptomyces luteosporeus TaxID=173856 RepID=A0ABN3TJB6_9ACTN